MSVATISTKSTLAVASIESPGSWVVDLVGAVTQAAWAADFTPAGGSGEPVAVEVIPVATMTQSGVILQMFLAYNQNYDENYYQSIDSF